MGRITSPQLVMGSGWPLWDSSRRIVPLGGIISPRPVMGSGWPLWGSPRRIIPWGDYITPSGDGFQMAPVGQPWEDHSIGVRHLPPSHNSVGEPQYRRLSRETPPLPPIPPHASSQAATSFTTHDPQATWSGQGIPSQRGGGLCGGARPWPSWGHPLPCDPCHMSHMVRLGDPWPERRRPPRRHMAAAEPRPPPPT